MFLSAERCIYPFEDEPVAGKKRVIYRSTPFGRPDATTSTVASMLGVTAPPPKPVLAKQRTKDISEARYTKQDKPVLQTYFGTIISLDIRGKSFLSHLL